MLRIRVGLAVTAVAPDHAILVVQHFVPASCPAVPKLGGRLSRVEERAQAILVPATTRHSTESADRRRVRAQSERQSGYAAGWRGFARRSARARARAHGEAGGGGRQRTATATCKS